MRVSSHVARRDFQKLMQAARRGKIIVVERHGRPVAGIVSPQLAESMLKSGGMISMIKIRRALKDTSKIRGVKALMLFGSYARGEATPRSDIDVAIVINDKADGLAVHERVERSVMGKHIRFEFLPVMETEWRTAKSGVVAVARREGKEI